jgi:hypothetical protein
MHITSTQTQLNLQFGGMQLGSQELDSADEMLNKLEKVEAATAPAMTTAQAPGNSAPVAAAAAVASTPAASVADHGFAPECPDCGSLLAMQEGCMMCNSCGFSKCT